MAKKQARRHKSKGKSGKKVARGAGKAAISGKKRTAGKARAKKGSKGAAAGVLRVHAIELLKWTHATTLKLADGFTDQQVMFQSVPTDNHLLWTFGHLAAGYSWFASLIDGKTADIPQDYGALFYANKPTSDATAYPPLETVRHNCEKAFARLLDAVSNLSDADAMKPPASEAHGFATTRLDAAYKAAWHEGWHQGQITTLRRALGMKGIY